MPKFYVISDVHGYYLEMRQALDEAGFDANDENSWLVSCGDEMDRGPDPEGVINYIMSLPRAIWIKGNHQSLMEDMIARGYPCSHDWHNGTMQSVLSLAPNAKTQSEAFTIAYEKTKPFFDKVINYFETEHYVFCHSWIPVKCEDGFPYYYRRNRRFSKNDDWRVAHQDEWAQSMWLNPLEMAMSGFGIEKTIISGHWHCSAGWAMEKGLSEFGNDACFEPYYYKDKLVMIDGCCAYSHKLNCIVIEDEFMEE